MYWEKLENCGYLVSFYFSLFSLLYAPACRAGLDARRHNILGGLPYEKKTSSRCCSTTCCLTTWPRDGLSGGAKAGETSAAGPAPPAVRVVPEGMRRDLPAEGFKGTCSLPLRHADGLVFHAFVREANAGQRPPEVHTYPEESATI